MGSAIITAGLPATATPSKSLRSATHAAMKSRSSASDETEKLIPPRKLTLEQALEFCREDECVEVTPTAVRIRKVMLDQKDRERSARKRSHA